MRRSDVSKPYRFCNAAAIYSSVSDGVVLESMWTQVLILHFLRTRKIPFVQSRPSAPVICITLAGIIAFTAITFTKGAAFFGLTHLPFWYFIFLLIVALLYMLLTTVVKAFYQKKYHELI